MILSISWIYRYVKRDFSTLSLLTLKTNYNLPISRIRENVVNFISRLDVILENEHSPSKGYFSLLNLLGLWDSVIFYLFIFSENRRRL